MTNGKQNGGKKKDSRPLSAAEQRREENESTWQNDSLAAPLRVAAWLDNRGTPLEFETAVAFNEAGFVVEQGLHEKQPDGKPLEIDVLAVRHKALAGRRAVFGHEIVVECKYAPRPWVAFSPLSRTTSDKGSYAQAKPVETATVEAARYLFHQYGQQMKRPDATVMPSLWPPGRLAFGLTALRGQDRDQDHGDKAYEALLGTVARARLRRERHEATRWHTTQMPVLVIGGELCMAEWDSKTKKIEVQETDSCIVEFRGDLVLPAVQIQVVTRAALQGWLSAFSSHVDARHNALENLVEDVEEALHASKLGQLEIDTNRPDGAQIHAMLGMVLARREQTSRMRVLGITDVK